MYCCVSDVCVWYWLCCPALFLDAEVVVQPVGSTEKWSEVKHLFLSPHWLWASWVWTLAVMAQCWWWWQWMCSNRQFKTGRRHKRAGQSELSLNKAEGLRSHYCNHQLWEDLQPHTLPAPQLHCNNPFLKKHGYLITLDPTAVWLQLHNIYRFVSREENYSNKSGFNWFAATKELQREFAQFSFSTMLPNIVLVPQSWLIYMCCCHI